MQNRQEKLHIICTHTHEGSFALRLIFIFSCSFSSAGWLFLALESFVSLSIYSAHCHAHFSSLKRFHSWIFMRKMMKIREGEWVGWTWDNTKNLIYRKSPEKISENFAPERQQQNEEKSFCFPLLRLPTMPLTLRPICKPLGKFHASPPLGNCCCCLRHCRRF